MTSCTLWFLLGNIQCQVQYTCFWGQFKHYRAYCCKQLDRIRYILWQDVCQTYFDHKDVQCNQADMYMFHPHGGTKMHAGSGTGSYTGNHTNHQGTLYHNSYRTSPDGTNTHLQTHQSHMVFIQSNLSITTAKALERWFIKAADSLQTGGLQHWVDQTAKLVL